MHHYLDRFSRHISSVDRIAQRIAKEQRGTGLRSRTTPGTPRRNQEPCRHSQQQRAAGRLIPAQGARLT